MPPLPKRKYPKARQGKRRSHDRIQAAHVVECPQCRSPRLAHHACPVCGYYKGREAVQVGAPNLPE
jgi:large subunit ribosomal protein L32